MCNQLQRRKKKDGALHCSTCCYDIFVEEAHKNCLLSTCGCVGVPFAFQQPLGAILWNLFRPACVQLRRCRPNLQTSNTKTFPAWKISLPSSGHGEEANISIFLDLKDYSLLNHHASLNHKSSLNKYLSQGLEKLPL